MEVKCYETANAGRAEARKMEADGERWCINLSCMSATGTLDPALRYICHTCGDRERRQRDGRRREGEGMKEKKENKNGTEKKREGKREEKRKKERKEKLVFLMSSNSHMSYL